MAHQVSTWQYVKRSFIIILLILMALLFLFWRIDNPRIEAMRLRLTDSMPDFSKVFQPIAAIGTFAVSFRSYEQLKRENTELRRKLREGDQWREAALQLEQTNAELRALNNLKFTGKDRFIAGEVSSDVGGNYAQAVLVNVGKAQGVEVGSAALDGLGLVGRVIAIGEEDSRVLLLNDPQSQISVTIMPDRTHAIVVGNGSLELDLNVIDTGKKTLAGARVVTSGDGVLPPDLLVGYITIDQNSQEHVKLAADYQALEFIRILLQRNQTEIAENPPIVVPQSLLNQNSPQAQESNDEGETAEDSAKTPDEADLAQ